MSRTVIKRVHIPEAALRHAFKIKLRTRHVKALTRRLLHLESCLDKALAAGKQRNGYVASEARALRAVLEQVEEHGGDE